MDFLKNVADSVTKAVNFVVDKNRKTAMINRLKIVIRNEKDTQARAYIELGKYYFENLRDPSNDTTEPHCVAVENADHRLKRAFSKLDELLVPAGDEEGACCCGEDCCGDDGCCEDSEASGEETDFFHTFSAAQPTDEKDGEAADDKPIE